MTLRDGQERQADREKDRFVQKLKAKPHSSEGLPLEIVKALLAEEASQYLHDLLKTLEASQEKIIEALAELARPKKWEFEINRNSLTGLITSVEAHQLTDD